MTLTPPKTKNATHLLFKLGLLAVGILGGCVTSPIENKKNWGGTVALPFMRMEANECYYIDDFLPTPDALVTGRSTGMFLRYYTYESAVYKIWNKEKLMLSFYSKDNRCWSLFEEYSTTIN